jgi:ribonuclease-3
MNPVTKNRRTEIKRVTIAKELNHEQHLVSNSNIDIDLTEDHVNRKTIEKIMGFKVNNLALYQRALTHVSIKTIVNKSDKSYVRPYLKESNESLEFLGDAVLKTIMAEYLFKRFPSKDEGFMTKVKTRMERTSMLAHFAECIGIKGHVLVSDQAISVGILINPALLEDAFEAITGASFLDFGFEKTRTFVLDIFEKYMDDGIILKDTNYKDALIRYCNSVKIKTPIFEVRGTEGPAHDRTFIVDVYMYKHELYGTGINKTKKGAEQEGSKYALNKLRV